MFKLLLFFISLALLGLVFLYLYRKYINKNASIIKLNLIGFPNVPAYPLSLSALIETLLNLKSREKEIKQAKAGLTVRYTIEGHEDNAYAFAFGRSKQDETEEAIDALLAEARKSADLFYRNPALVTKKLKSEGYIAEPKSTTPDNPMERRLLGKQLTNLSLDTPQQFALAWTTLGNLHRKASKEVLPKWSKTLLDSAEATKQFFPTIAKYGVAYNLLILQKVTNANIRKYKTAFANEWTTAMDTLFNQGNLYIIDLRIYEMLKPQEVKGSERFTPATFTWLKRDAVTKEITPFAVHVSGQNGSNAQFYDLKTAQPSAWLYALQAVKVSVTVYGIWLGHVYHWHLVPAAMIMTMFNNLPTTHPIYSILAPQSQHIIGFNDGLVLLWRQAAPPTSIKTAHQFLELIDKFAEKRSFFDDDPNTTIKKLGLVEADFTVTKPWDKYPIIAYLLYIWDIVSNYVDEFVEISYKNDKAIQKDKHLQKWITASSHSEGGNIKGLPEMKDKNDLKKVLRSMLYRVTAHGISRLDNTANPAMSFVGNYPPCLQSSHIPEPSSTLSTKELLQYMPKTGTVGEMITFYYTFVYSAPYEPIIPLTGVGDNLFFKGKKANALNVALIKFRDELTIFMEKYAEANKLPNLLSDTPQIHQWPMSVET
ncbi:MAG: lipoxygenase family protein [Chitinophagales bacterium]